MDNFKQTALVRLFALSKVPLLGSVWPKVTEITAQKLALRIRLTRKTKNHLGSMYFGALCMGAEAAVGIKAFEIIRQSRPRRVDLIFKDFHADFLKRAEGDVEFVCDQGDEIKALVEKCLATNQRETQTFKAQAFVPQQNPTEPVASFAVTLSVKARG